MMKTRMPTVVERNKTQYEEELTRPYVTNMPLSIGTIKYPSFGSYQAKMDAVGIHASLAPHADGVGRHQLWKPDQILNHWTDDHYILLSRIMNRRSLMLSYHIV